jgi:hypothetical protein
VPPQSPSSYKRVGEILRFYKGKILEQILEIFAFEWHVLKIAFSHILADSLKQNKIVNGRASEIFTLNVKLKLILYINLNIEII